MEVLGTVSRGPGLWDPGWRLMDVVGVGTPLQRRTRATARGRPLQGCPSTAGGKGHRRHSLPRREFLQGLASAPFHPLHRRERDSDTPRRVWH
jgi:hypothetical protein